MRKHLFAILCILFFLTLAQAQEGGAATVVPAPATGTVTVPGVPVPVEAQAIEAAMKAQGGAAAAVEGLDLNTQVEQGQQQLLEQLKQADKLDQLQDKAQQAELELGDEDDEKIVNIRSKDFLREITTSTKGYYGYDLFYTSRGFKLESSMTAYSDYQIGPGDEIVIAMWGDVELRNVLRVSNEGTIYVNNVGLVSVNGLSLDELEAKLKNLLSKAYITLAPPSGEARTYLDVSLGKLRPITVFLVGEVFKKGAIKLDSYSTVFTALYNSGGPTAKGTLRDIRVIRDGKIVSTIDIYDYLLTGNKVNDIILKNGDNILVQPRFSAVKLEGEVNNKSIYELKPDETMADLMKFSGGIRITAQLARFQVVRILPFEKRTSDIMHSKEVLEYRLGRSENEKVIIDPVKVKDGDIVTIFPISNILINYVNIEGPVLLPGKYSLDNNMTVKSFIDKAGGLLPETYLEKAHLTRTMPDLTTKLFDIDLRDAKSLGFKLESSDVLKIYSIWELITKNKVTISGHVKKVGTITLDEGAKISDLIQMAGGLEDEVFRKKTHLERADLIRLNEDGITTKIIPVNLRKILEGDKAEDMVLLNKDHLKVYSIDITVFPKTVTIKGLVKKPGTFDLSSNMTPEDLILQAGGFEKGAYIYEAEIFRIDPYNVKPEKLISAHKKKIDLNFFRSETSRPLDQFTLEDNDLVIVRKHPDFQFQRNVELKGEVRFPGTYSLMKEKETLAEVIERAGGLKNEAFPQGILFNRGEKQVLSNFEKVTHGSRGGELMLQHGDVITIPKHPGVVSVEGFVFSPGLVKYESSWSLSDYVAAAGGVMVDDNYEKGETVVYYPGGAAKVDGWLFSPSVKEGSRIVVKKEKKPEEKEGTSLKDWVAIIASIVTISYYLSNTN
jgi:polysaccharide biosynthesis/export protein